MTKILKRIPYTKADFAWVKWGPADIRKKTNEALQKKKKSNEILKKIKDKDLNFDNSLYHLEKSAAEFTRTAGAIGLLLSVSPDKKTRDAAKSAIDVMEKKMIDIEYDPKVYKKIKFYSTKKDKLDGPSAKLLKDALLGYKRMGFELSDQKQKILKKKFKELAKLSTAFSKEIDDWRDNVRLSKKELSGLPENFINRLQKDKRGNYLATLDYPIYGPFMEYADSEEKRKELFNKNVTKGGEKNTKRLTEIIKLRKEISIILGYKDYASYENEIQMSKTGTAVFNFIDSLIKKVGSASGKDIHKLLKEKVSLTGNKNARLELHDISYLMGHIKRRELNLDSEKVREYFVMDRVISETFVIYGKLLSVKFKEIKEIKLWHKDVVYYGVYTTNDEVIGYFAFDLYPREGKYTHMGVSGLFHGEVDDKSGLYRAPFAVMLGNFSPPQKGVPSTLSHYEVNVFFHEFGHLMHDVLTEAKYYSQSCTSVSTDFVEMPSQLFENWTIDRNILKRLSGHYKNPSKKIPDSMIDAIIKSDKFMKGYAAMRQLVFSLYDYTLHTGKKIGDVNKTYNDLHKKYTGIVVFKDAMFGAGFGHLMGYAAKYYSYMWSLVYADDMFTRFKKEGIMNPKTGMDFRTKILAKGGSEDEMKMLMDFLGRKPNNKAFLKELGIK